MARPLDEEFDTVMDVERNPTGAWQAIQSLARVRYAVDDVICGRGMFGLSDKDDLEWAISRLLDAICPPEQNGTGTRIPEQASEQSAYTSRDPAWILDKVMKSQEE